MTNSNLKIQFALLATLALIGPSYAADTTQGEQVFKNYCAKCHEIGADAQNAVGPSLNNLFGRKAGAAPGFKFYSEANLKANFIWTEDNFKTYIRNPKGMIQATKQIFKGLSNQQEIDALTDYLKSFSAATPVSAAPEAPAAPVAPSPTPKKK